MKKLFKSEKGYTGIDIAIAISVLVIFTALISTIFINIYLQHAASQRNAAATSYMTTIAELVDRTYYQNINFDDIEDEDNFVNKVKALFNNAYTIDTERIAATGNEDEKIVLTVSNGYTITLSISRYIPEGMTAENSKDLVKTVKIAVSYKNGSMTKNVKTEKIKSKEILITPNKPVIASKMVAVKYVVPDAISEIGYWEIASEKDSTWYNYDNKNWAKAMLIDDLVVEGGITVTESNKDMLAGKRILTQGKVFEWIPRYAYNSTASNITFLYSTTDKYVDANGTLQDPAEGYDITGANTAFGSNSGLWVAKEDYSISNDKITQFSLNTITAEQKQAVTRFSESKYGKNASEYSNISNDRLTK